MKTKIDNFAFAETPFATIMPGSKVSLLGLRVLNFIIIDILPNAYGYV
jgi:hypothetical protein